MYNKDRNAKMILMNIPFLNPREILFLKNTKFLVIEILLLQIQLSETRRQYLKYIRQKYIRLFPFDHESNKR